MQPVSHLARRSSRRRVRFEEPPDEADAAQQQQEDAAVPSSSAPPDQFLLEQKRQQCLGMFQTNGLTQPQRRFLEQMGLGTKGPADTIGDGECQFRSFSQSIAGFSKGTVWSMSNSEEAQSGYASARSIAAAAITTNSVIREGIVEHADQLMRKGACCGAQVDIIVIAPDQVLLYSKDACYAPPQERSKSADRKLPAYCIFPNSYGRQKYDLPAEAFMPATRFLLYDGKCHYCAAYRKSEVEGSAAPSVSSAEAAGLKVLHPCSLPSLATVSTASRGLRSPTTRAAAKKQAPVQHNIGAAQRPLCRCIGVGCHPSAVE